MMRARVTGSLVWCSRPGCTYPRAFGQLVPADDGSMYTRLRGRRWRRDGFLDGLERYIAVDRRNERRQKLPDGRVKKTRGPDTRPLCPFVVVCPECETPQAIGLPSLD